MAAGGVAFTLVYGYLQELIVVQIFDRELALFLATVQFMGYAVWSAALRRLTPRTPRTPTAKFGAVSGAGASALSISHRPTPAPVPFRKYMWLSILRAFDLGFTNLGMKYLNYPAKTLIKSCRVVFTMAAGAVVQGKKYRPAEYATVSLMVMGLVVFMRADMKTSAVFAPVGIILLVASLMCDAVLSTNSETLMKTHDINQDEFIFRLYSISLVAMGAAAALDGEMTAGLSFVLRPGTMHEVVHGSVPTWTAGGKMAALFVFASTGFLGSSCAGAITKRFSALAMSIVSTTRKAASLFLSFLFFPKECTTQHMVGMAMFVVALFVKSMRAGRKGMRSRGEEADKKQGGALPMTRFDERRII
uniref:Sugar phosphate transporter domain-containing protein n=1 Tax=Corethron hystrix TaxID=216773 RepID=A0A7S1G179_9STRA